MGLATKAAAGNEKGAVLLGYSPQWLAQSSFMLASLIGGLIVILASPMIQLSSGVFTFGYLIPALGAALIGAFRKVWPTVITGLLIGLVQSTFTKMQSDFSCFPQYGAREGLPFLVIIVAMVFLGERLPDRGAVEEFRIPAIPPAKITALSIVVPVGVAVAGLLVLDPLWRGAIMTTTIATVLALSLVLLTGFGGQPSLAQMAFAGVAGFALSKLAMQWGIPFPIAPVFASIIAMLFGIVVGIPALRVRGTNLAIITLAGGLAISEFVFKNPKYVGDASTGGAKVDNPKLGNWDLGLILGDQASRPIFGIFLVAVALVTTLFTDDMTPRIVELDLDVDNDAVAVDLGKPFAATDLEPLDKKFILRPKAVDPLRSIADSVANNLGVSGFDVWRSQTRRAGVEAVAGAPLILLIGSDVTRTHPTREQRFLLARKAISRTPGLMPGPL